MGFPGGRALIFLYTDFGLRGPYIGQLQAAIYRYSPDARVVNLIADAPAFDPKAAAYLLAACVHEFDGNPVFLCVVDPGVGMAERAPVVVRADDQVFVGPDNGLFDVVAKHARTQAEKYRIVWRPPRLSASFHGRDLFAPVAALLDASRLPDEWLAASEPMACHNVDADVDEIIYLDDFGNAMTGRRAAFVGDAATLVIQGCVLERRRTFGDVAEGEAFWYENSSGLVEIAVNRGSAARTLGLRIGQPFLWR